MLPLELDRVRRQMPETWSFVTYDDHESAWLMARLMPERAKVSALRATAFGNLLDRPALAPLVAQCGGVLDRRDVLALADAPRMADAVTAAGEAAVAAIYDRPWSDYTLSLDAWGDGLLAQWAQMTRDGVNLVLQLGFPADHAALMSKFCAGPREKYQEEDHPIRLEGCPTLAWARLDLDADTGELLIEEVQSDWLRIATSARQKEERCAPKSRDLRNARAYERALMTRYAKRWPSAIMLAVLDLAVRELGVRRVWMHTPELGAALKGIEDALPPRSLYTQLPRRFCFAPTREIPQMLRKDRSDLRELSAHAEGTDPWFWVLDL